MGPGSSLAAVLWWLAVRTSSVDPSQPLPSQLRKMARNKNHCGAPASDCAFLGPPAKYTGRYAVFMAGRVRVAHLALQKAKALIARRYAGNIRVDWYAHLCALGGLPRVQAGLLRVRLPPRVARRRPPRRL